jgi:Leucine-rich repeat (LRR) protein
LQGELIIADFPNLKKINLANSKGITKMTITNCPQVKEVNVSNNQIAELVINEPTNLNNLPLMPQGETLDTLLQRPTREQLEQVKEELNIERDHAQDIDNWYRRLIDGSLGNEVLQLQ